ncbi:hypothetical protein [Caballeronia sp. dw_19]|uniref:hypothetical protein n=1 Tax=Caballeronia sp. dw_19 TaxID=2719791 RepID=UPI001BD411BF|nr:hypothetical protein [Caballeronia sp. dw_19]
MQKLIVLIASTLALSSAFGASREIDLVGETGTNFSVHVQLLPSTNDSSKGDATFTTHARQSFKQKGAYVETPDGFTVTLDNKVQLVFTGQNKHYSLDEVGVLYVQQHSGIADVQTWHQAK